MGIRVHIYLLGTVLRDPRKSLSGEEMSYCADGVAVLSLLAGLGMSSSNMVKNKFKRAVITSLSFVREGMLSERHAELETEEGEAFLYDIT